ncbi:DNA polymerase III subunit gamma/tau [Otariodibacter oris]|uniref:DNA polymerase III subunit gamma/tau n=1 Tax=Otariodibacter oris TaxID=1032623 RepID=A0A420XJ94_9PAST|nr:DNA polymerase III subunit gamma/tau [Otariodibacter oris]QGM80520.1 DNA polymerase III subunit gamma/tau [Otariodibacter oris]RKR77329.1 DNA polymerase III gamma subunit /DNA polymerase III tau subunit [Otariodibacter oris]
MSSYQVLARKWRPQRFSDVVGQQHVLAALENGLREGRLHHAYLFSGTRGVGKTSIARLFAKGLNCEKGITADPCGQCENCKAIEEGRFIDLIEIDAASRTKVEDTRELLDNVQYKPTVGRFKVYLIDEVHMLSRHSFNALLKTLEEPPQYVKFLLATTDPQKLPITILSRCIQFHLRALEQQQIQDHLSFILKQENIPFEVLALEKLAKAAQGSIRDSLSLTDQAIAMSNANVTADVVSQMLGLIDDHQPLELVQALALADGEKAMNVIQSVATKGVDWQQFLSDLAETLHKIAMLQLLPKSAQEETTLHFLARQISPEDIQFFYQLILTGKKELPFAPDQRIGVEMTILRALAFHPKYVESSSATTEIKPTQPQPARQVQPQAQPSQQFEQLREKLRHNQQPQAERQVQAQQKPEQAVSSAQQSANVSVTESKPVTTPTTVVTTEYNSENDIVANAALALNALKKLQGQTESQDEKKKPEVIPKKPKQSSDLSIQERFANLAKKAEPIHKTQKSQPQQSQATKSTDEDYRWTWLNPELEIEESSPKPSDIKQAILQEKTPELLRKTIALSCEQDEWCKIVESLDLPGLVRQVALNSYLTSREGNHLHLILKSSVAHLNHPDNLKKLADALAAQGLTYDLSLGESNGNQTPLELRRIIYEQMTAEAKQALLKDPKLKLLMDTFNAQLDESTIRAVVIEE